jgi:flagellar basal body rod protein FlgG
MNVGIYKGAAALTAFERWQETIAQNLASVAVPGYRKSETNFTGVVADVMKLKKGDKVTQIQDGIMPDAKRTLNVTPGSYTYTGVDTNFAINGPGFFRVRKPDGTIGYTRNGNFRLNNEYLLSTQDGFTVEGENGPITFRQEGGKVFINSDGLIIQDKQQIGKMAVFDFAKPGELHRIGDGLMAPAPDNQATPQERISVLHMSVENSNVRPMEEMINMISLGRAYDCAKKVIDTSDDNSAKAIQYLGGQS